MGDVRSCYSLLMNRVEVYLITPTDENLTEAKKEIKKSLELKGRSEGCKYIRGLAEQLSKNVLQEERLTREGVVKRIGKFLVSFPKDKRRQIYSGLIYLQRRVRGLPPLNVYEHSKELDSQESRLKEGNFQNGELEGMLKNADYDLSYYDKH